MELCVINSGGYARDGLVKPDFCSAWVMVWVELNRVSLLFTKSGSERICRHHGREQWHFLTNGCKNEPGARGVNSNQIRSIILLRRMKRPLMEYVEQGI